MRELQVAIDAARQAGAAVRGFYKDSYTVKEKGADNPLTDAKMVNRTPRNRAVGGGAARARDEFLPRAGVAGRGGVNHPAPHGAVRADSGHDDPHQLSLSPSAAFRQVDGDDSGRRACPAGYTPH